MRKAVVSAPGHDDLERAERLDVDRLACDDDRPVPGADARPVREQRVVLLHERVRGKRDRRHLEPPRPRPLVERLDVRQHLLEPEPATIDEVGRSAPST